MKTLTDQLAGYAAYHRDRRNIATHLVGVPMIVLAVVVLLSRPTLGELAGVAITPALLAALARLTRERGGARLEWSVLDWNAPAIGFYARLGASAMAEWTTFRLTDDALEQLAATGEAVTRRG